MYNSQMPFMQERGAPRKRTSLADMAKLSQQSAPDMQDPMAFLKKLAGEEEKPGGGTPAPGGGGGVTAMGGGGSAFGGMGGGGIADLLDPESFGSLLMLFGGGA